MAVLPRKKTLDRITGFFKMYKMSPLNPVIPVTSVNPVVLVYPVILSHFAIVEAVVVVFGVPSCVVSGTFSIVNLIRSSTTAVRSLVSR
jgi:hypothetical protein